MNRKPLYEAVMKALYLPNKNELEGLMDWRESVNYEQQFANNILYPYYTYKKKIEK